jgi:hypothetical protein
LASFFRKYETAHKSNVSDRAVSKAGADPFRQGNRRHIQKQALKGLRWTCNFYSLKHTLMQENEKEEDGFQ